MLDNVIDTCQAVKVNDVERSHLYGKSSQTTAKKIIKNYKKPEMFCEQCCPKWSSDEGKI